MTTHIFWKEPVDHKLWNLIVRWNQEKSGWTLVVVSDLSFVDEFKKWVASAGLNIKADEKHDCYSFFDPAEHHEMIRFCVDNNFDTSCYDYVWVIK